MPRVELDPSLIGGGGNAFATAYQNALANNFKNQAAQQDIDINQYKMDAARQEQQQSNALAQYLAAQNGAPLTPQSQAQMYSAGGVKNTQTYLKVQGDLAKVNADTAKTGVETDKLTAEVADKKFATARNLLNTVQTPQQAAEWLKGAFSDPHIGPMIKQFSTYEDAVTRIGNDPQSLAAWKNQAGLTAEKLVEKMHQDVVAAETGRHNLATEKNSVDNNVRTNTTAETTAKMVDTRTRESTAATREVATATRDAAKTSSNQAAEMKFGDDYRAQSKDFKLVGDAYRQINSTLDSASKSPAATLAAATKFMKLLDPGSVVRESELGMAMAASGVIDRAKNYVNVLELGRVLTPNQVKDFKAITEQIYGASQAGQRQVDETYKEYARANGLRPEMILQDLGQNKGKGAEKEKQDSAAAAWAKSNPNDPRAAKILQHLGR